MLAVGASWKHLESFWSRLKASGAVLKLLRVLLQALGPVGALRALLGVPPRLFGMDLEVRTAKEEGIHNEPSEQKTKHSFPHTNATRCCAHMP